MHMNNEQFVYARIFFLLCDFLFIFVRLYNNNTNVMSNFSITVKFILLLLLFVICLFVCLFVVKVCSQ